MMRTDSNARRLTSCAIITTAICLLSAPMVLAVSDESVNYQVVVSPLGVPLKADVVQGTRVKVDVVKGDPKKVDVVQGAPVKVDVVNIAPIKVDVIQGAPVKVNVVNVAPTKVVD